MTTLHSIFHRGLLALALLGTGIAGPQLLPQPAPVADAREACVIARDAVLAAERSSTAARAHVMALAQRSRQRGNGPRS